jgi:hypothetical protein
MSGAEGMAAAVQREEGEEAKNKRTICKLNLHLEESAVPNATLLAGNLALPALQVEHALGRLDGAGDEAERVVFAPCFPVAPVESDGGPRGVRRRAYRSSFSRFWQREDILVGCRELVMMEMVWRSGMRGGVEEMVSEMSQGGANEKWEDEWRGGDGD